MLVIILVVLKYCFEVLVFILGQLVLVHLLESLVLENIRHVSLLARWSREPLYLGYDAFITSSISKSCLHLYRDLRQVTIYEETCQLSSECVLLPPTSTEVFSTHPRQADNCQSDRHMRPKRLNYCNSVGRADAEVNHRSTAARSECCWEITLWFRSEKTVLFKAVCAIRTALASLQTMYFHTEQSPSYLSDLSSRVDQQYRISFPTSFREQSTSYEQPSTDLKQ